MRERMKEEYRYLIVNDDYFVPTEQQRRSKQIVIPKSLYDVLIKKAKEEERAKLSKTLWNYEQDNNKMRKKLLNSQKRNKELKKQIEKLKTNKEE